jgi:hypothetical protein
LIKSVENILSGLYEKEYYNIIKLRIAPFVQSYLRSYASDKGTSITQALQEFIEKTSMDKIE